MLNLGTVFVYMHLVHIEQFVEESVTFF